MLSLLFDLSLLSSSLSPSSHKASVVERISYQNENIQLGVRSVDGYNVHSHI